MHLRKVWVQMIQVNYSLLPILPTIYHDKKSLFYFIFLQDALTVKIHALTLLLIIVQTQYNQTWSIAMWHSVTMQHFCRTKVRWYNLGREFWSKHWRKCVVFLKYGQYYDAVYASGSTTIELKDGEATLHYTNSNSISFVRNLVCHYGGAVTILCGRSCRKCC